MLCLSPDSFLRCAWPRIASTLPRIPTDSMADNAQSAGFTRTSPTNLLVRSACEYCQAIFISTKEEVTRLETAHRKDCKHAKNANRD